MSVLIQPLAAPIMDLISVEGSPKLDARRIEILDWCQTMSSDVWSGRIDGELCCVFGLIPPSLISQQAYLWMHATERVEEHKFRFVRHSQLVIETMLEKYPIIVGHCAIDNHSAIRWVRWLRGVFGEADGLYLPFRIERRS